MKKETNKKVTINDLANNIDTLAIMVAKGFDRVDAKIDKEIGEVKEKLGKVEKRLENVEESIATTNNNVLSLGDRTVPRFEFDKHLLRFSDLERRVKVK